MTTRRHPQWLACIWRQFGPGGGVDFIGGRCLLFESPRPAWRDGYLGVIGWVIPGPEPSYG
jgi:hypothetical protein